MPPVRGRGSPLCSEFGSTEHGEPDGGQRLTQAPVPYMNNVMADPRASWM